MDDLVKRAMARWPSVPAVHGWLRLGRRGTWFLIDRNAPGFDPVRDSGGSPITSPPIIDFIQRNYEADDDGNWYFQNGPQRVFVTLDHAPLIFRVTGEGDARALAAHTGRPVGAIREARFDRQGNLFLQTDVGPGMVDDRDLVRLVADEETADEDAADRDAAQGHAAQGHVAEGNVAEGGAAEGKAGTDPNGSAGGGDVLRLSLPRYGFAIEWREADADQALPVETIATRFGYQRRPEAPAGAVPPSPPVD